MTALRPQLGMELWMLRPYLRQFGFVLFFGVMYTAFLEAGTPVMVAIALLTSSYAFSITEANKLEILFASLPTSRATVVWARYLVSAATLFALGLIGVGLEAGRAAVLRQAWSPASGFALLAVSFAVAAVVIGIQFPFFFGMGYNRARPVTFVSMFLVVGAVTMTYMPQSDGGVPTDLAALPGQHPVGIIVTGILVGLAALAGSAAISVRLYWRKDL